MTVADFCEVIDCKALKLLVKDIDRLPRNGLSAARFHMIMESSPRLGLFGEPLHGTEIF